MRNRFDQTAYNKRYYAMNKGEERARVERRRQAMIQTLRRLREVPCVDCGESFPPYMMDFDHRDPTTKVGNVTWMAGKAASRRVLAEAAKCDIVCANCHRLRTIKRSVCPLTPPSGRRTEYHRKRWRADMAFLRQVRDVPCAECGRYFGPEVMEFDHRDPTEKAFEVTRFVGRKPREALVAEIQKCDVVCANCHRERTRRWYDSIRAGVAQLEERWPSKPVVAGSSPVSRSENLQQLVLF